MLSGMLHALESDQAPTPLPPFLELGLNPPPGLLHCPQLWQLPTHIWAFCRFWRAAIHDWASPN